MKSTSLHIKFWEPLKICMCLYVYLQAYLFLAFILDINSDTLKINTGKQLIHKTYLVIYRQIFLKLYILLCCSAKTTQQLGRKKLLGNERNAQRKVGKPNIKIRENTLEFHDFFKLSCLILVPHIDFRCFITLTTMKVKI